MINNLYIDILLLSSAFVQFIEKEVADSLPLLLDQCNRRLIQLLTQWKTVAQITQTAKVCFLPVEDQVPLVLMLDFLVFPLTLSTLFMKGLKGGVFNVFLYWVSGEVPSVYNISDHKDNDL